jgi:hypothetical protein
MRAFSRAMSKNAVDLLGGIAHAHVGIRRL